jgi:recombination associated protein RdgC
MFKTIIVFRIGEEWEAPSQAVLEDTLQRNAFQPCDPTQLESVGWVSPRPEDHSAFVEAQSGHLLMKVKVERKTVPAAAIKHALEERCKELERTRGAKPGRKEKKDLKEDIKLELLPRAFSKFTSNLVWIDTKNRYLVVGAGSSRAADAVVNNLVTAMALAKAVITLTPIHTVTSPTKAMTDWLFTHTAPEKFTVDQECELREQMEGEAVVRYSNHSLDIEEITEHIKNGKAATKLAMTWNDKVSFMLSGDLVIRKISFSDGIFKDAGDEKNFDTDFAISTAELSELFTDLLAALGGELELGQAAE